MKVNCRALHHEKKKWTLTGNLVKNPGFALKTHFVEVSFVIMIPTSCYVHFY